MRWKHSVCLHSLGTIQLVFIGKVGLHGLLKATVSSYCEQVCRTRKHKGKRQAEWRKY